MGLLDQFAGLGNLSEDQTQGLLAAAAQMLQASGPSRTPASFGQIAGAGIGAYSAGSQASKQRRFEEEQARQMAAMRGLQMRGVQGELEDRDAQRAKAQELAALQARFAQQGAGAQPAAPAPLGTQPMMSMPGQPQPQPQPQQAGGGSGGGSVYDQQMAYAQFLQANGKGAEALAIAKAAQDLRPKVKSWEKVRENGRTLLKPYFEDGSTGAPVTADVAEKLEFRDGGGTTDGIDSYTGAVKVRIGKTTSISDSIAQSRLGFDRERFNYDKTKETKPVFNADLGGFVLPPSARNPNGGIIPLAGAPNRGPKMTEDQAKATGWLVQAENAFGNMKGALKNNPEAAKPGLNDALAGIPSFGVTGALANTLRGKDRQKFMQGASSLSESLLRAATGAGVNRDEAEQKVRELTPVFGDDEETIQQKMDAIPLYIDSLKVRAGPGAALASGVISNKAKPASGGWSITKVD